MNIIGCIPRFFKNHLSKLLTIGTGLGMLGTVILVAKEAPVVKERLQTATDEKGEPLTLGEKAGIVVPICLPAIATGGATLGLLIFREVKYAKLEKAYSALVSSYILLGEEFAEYRKQVREAVGEEKEREIWIESRKEIKRLKEENERLKKQKGKELYTLAWMPGIIFDSTPAHMNDVFYRMVYNMLTQGGISLSEMNDHIGIPDDCYDRKKFEAYGWSAYENEVTYGNAAVEFETHDVVNLDGEIIHVIDVYDGPYELDHDYGGTESSVDFIWEQYNFELAAELARSSTDKDVERFDPPKNTFVHLW